MSQQEKIKRILFLGAGASKDAGYPLANEIFNLIDNEYRNNNDWKEFKDFRQQASEELGLILKSENPELVLTWPDLIAASLKESDQRIFSQAVLEARRGKGEGGITKKRMHSIKNGIILYGKL